MARTVAVLVAVLVLLLEAPPAASAAPGTPVARWEDAKGREVVLREGAWDRGSGKGFGMEKIREKHEIHRVSSVRFVTSNPDGGVPDRNQWRYEAYANKKVCRQGVCTYVESRRVLAIVDFKSVPSYYGHRVDGVLGVMTTYCDNPDLADECPPWVETGLNHPAVGVGERTSSAPGTSVDWSYAPVPPHAVGDAR